MSTQKEEHMRAMRAYIAEFIGTGALILFGAGSIIVTQAMVGSSAALIAVALAHGLIIACMVSTFGAISGGHFNPAVTFGFIVSRKMPKRKAYGYIVAQLLGAVAGAIALQARFFPRTWEAAQLGTPMLASDVSFWQGVFIEAVLTFILMMVIFGTAVDSRAPKVGGLFIGFAITIDILLGGVLTGAAMNPARTFGPALMGWIGGASYNPWAGHLVYWLGPLIGAGIAAWVYKKIFE